MKKFLLSIGVLLLAVVLLAAGIWGGLRLSYTHPDFPIWETVSGTDRIRDSLELRPLALTTDIRAGNMVWDELETAIIDRDDSYVSGPCFSYRVDFRRFGCWYTVYNSVNTANVHTGLDDPESTASLRFPRGLFSQPGRYRVYMDGFGYVGGVNGFDIASVPVSQCIWEDAVPSLYPKWEPVTATDEINDKAVLESELSAANSSGTVDIMVRIQNNSDQSLDLTQGYRVDYLHNDSWYTVYTPKRFVGKSNAVGPGRSVFESYAVPASFKFELTGTYRIYIIGVGYYQFETEDKHPPTFNSFPNWVEAPEQSTVNDHAQLEFVALVTLGDTARLTMNLVNTSKTDSLVFGKDYRIDYLADDTWYTVTPAYAVPMIAEVQESDTASTKTFSDSANIFSQPGAYRYWLSDVACLTFTITEDFGVIAHSDDEDPATEGVRLTGGEATVTSGGEYVLSVQAENGSGETIDLTQGYRIDCLTGDVWSAVYGPVPYSDDAWIHPDPVSPGGTEMGEYAMPESFMDIPGEYRLYIQNIGYYEFTIASKLASTEGNTKNPEVTDLLFHGAQVWAPVGSQEWEPEDVVNPYVTLNFSSMTAEDGTVLLEFELIEPRVDSDQHFHADIYPQCYRIDYLEDDVWYAVFRYDDYRMIAAGGGGNPPRNEAGNRLIYTRCLPETLSKPGTYRYYTRNLNYCEFEVE